LASGLWTPPWPQACSMCSSSNREGEGGSHTQLLSKSRRVSLACDILTRHQDASCPNKLVLWECAPTRLQQASDSPDFGSDFRHQASVVGLLPALCLCSLLALQSSLFLRVQRNLKPLAGSKVRLASKAGSIQGLGRCPPPTVSMLSLHSFLVWPPGHTLGQ